MDKGSESWAHRWLFIHDWSLLNQTAGEVFEPNFENFAAKDIYAQYSSSNSYPLGFRITSYDETVEDIDYAKSLSYKKSWKADKEILVAAH